MATWTWFHRFGSPPWVYGFATRWSPWFGVAAVLMMLIALYGGLVLAPPDYQQKDAFRIVYIHAPVASMSYWATCTCEGSSRGRYSSQRQSRGVLPPLASAMSS